VQLDLPQRERGRAALVNVSDLDEITKIKDILAGGSHVGYTPDFPQVLTLWRGAYVFIMGRNQMSAYET